MSILPGVPFTVAADTIRRRYSTEDITGFVVTQRHDGERLDHAIFFQIEKAETFAKVLNMINSGSGLRRA